MNAHLQIEQILGDKIFAALKLSIPVYKVYLSLAAAFGILANNCFFSIFRRIPKHPNA